MNAKLETGLIADKALPGVNREGQVVVCMNCWPKLADFYATFPQFQRCEVTSTFCHRHMDEIRRQYSTPALSGHQPGNN